LPEAGPVVRAGTHEGRTDERTGSIRLENSGVHTKRLEQRATREFQIIQVPTAQRLPNDFGKDLRRAARVFPARAGWRSERLSRCKSALICFVEKHDSYVRQRVRIIFIKL
jgi:hypothetical protein